MPTSIPSVATSHTFSQEVLRALALGSFPQTPAEKAKSASVVRSALRCRRRKGLSREQREMVGNAEKSSIVVSKLVPYLHDLLGDVTKKQSRVIAQTVKKGIDRKWADSTVARTLARYADLDPERAKVVARTEMARARSDVSLGKRPDSARVVFVLGDEDACPICKALEGTVRTVRKAQGVIPVHPNCSCRWEDAPKGARVTANQFCATGAGGGIDPHCSPDDGDGGVTDHRIAHINLPESREEATAIAWAMRDNVIGDGEDDCAVDGDCLIAAAEGFMLHPDAEIWGGRYIDSEKGPWEHQIVKLGDWFIDVTEDQFSGIKSQATVFNTDDLLRGKNGAAPYQYAGFERLPATEEMTLKRRKPGYRPGTVAELANYEDTDRLLAVPKPTANFRESLLRFSRLVDNQFCATGEGGGVDPSCSPGGKIGEGNMGAVVRDGDYVLKNAIRKDGTNSKEGEIYDLLKGVEGVADGVQVGDKIRVRHYQEVLGLDAVPNERDRLGMSSVVGTNENVKRLLSAFNALAEHGIDYNDHIQVGFDDNWKAHLLDFSNAGRNDPFQAETNNYSRLDQWLRDFGADGAADNISDTYGAMKYLDFKTHLPQEKLNALKEKLKTDPNRSHLAPALDKIKGKKLVAAYYSRNPRPVEETGRDIIQSDLSPGGLRMVFATAPLDDDTIRQYNLMPVVHRPKKI